MKTVLEGQNKSRKLTNITDRDMFQLKQIWGSTYSFFAAP